MFPRASLLAVLLFAAPAGAAPACPETLVTFLATGTMSGLGSCFSPAPTWTDEAGVSTRPAAALEGLARLRRRARAEKPQWTAFSSGTVLLSGLTDVSYPWPGHLLVVLDGPSTGPWTAARVYRGARPWPEPLSGGPPADTREGPDADRAFNETMGSGDPGAWAARWSPDGEFVSVVGPFKGPDVKVFFERQTERYAKVETFTSRQHARRSDGSLVFEGNLRGRCRAAGAAFDFPYVMAVRARAGVIEYVYEAFTSLGDGCGPFWTMPR